MHARVIRRSYDHRLKTRASSSRRVDVSALTLLSRYHSPISLSHRENGAFPRFFGSVQNFVGRLGRDRQFLRSLSRIFNAGTSRRLHFDYLATALDQREFDTGYCAVRRGASRVAQLRDNRHLLTGSPSEGLTFGGPTGAYFILLALGAKAKSVSLLISSDMSHSFSSRRPLQRAVLAVGMEVDHSCRPRTAQVHRISDHHRAYVEMMLMITFRHSNAVRRCR